MATDICIYIYIYIYICLPTTLRRAHATRSRRPSTQMRIPPRGGPRVTCSGPPSRRNGGAPREPTLRTRHGLLPPAPTEVGVFSSCTPAPQNAHVRTQFGNPHAECMEAHSRHAGQAPTLYRLANAGSGISPPKGDDLYA